jgi:hypothetical protein
VSGSGDAAAEKRFRRACSRVARALVLGAVAGVWSSCSGFAPSSDVAPGNQVDTDPSNPWRCLGRTVATPPAPVFAGAAPRVVFSLQVVDLSTGRIFPSLQVRACGLADVNCESPVADSLTVDSRGYVDVPLFQGFTGFLELTSPDVVPARFYLTDALPAEALTEYPLAMIAPTTLGPLAQLVGVQIEAGTGLFAARVFDCDGKTASGVSLSTRSRGTPWYFVDGLPTNMTSATGAEGLGGFVNVPPGLTAVDAKAPSGASIVGTQSVVVTPGWFSTVFIRPTGGLRTPPE